MTKDNEPFSLLDDIRARVIYFSCLVEPKNILEISELWDYKSPTYFYQANSKKIIEKLVSSELISILKGVRYQANFGLLLEKNGVIEFFKQTNKILSNEIIVEKFDFEITKSQLEDPLFKEFCIQKKPELGTILEGIVISNKEINSFLSLWKNPLFKKIFLSADVIKKLLDDRKDLPRNPRELIFSITLNICDKIYYFKEKGTSDFPDPYFWLNIDEIFPLIYSNMKSAIEQDHQESKILFNNLTEVYNLLKQKFSIYQGKSEIGAYHIAKIVELLGI